MVMNKNRALRACLIAVLVSSGTSFAGPWDWVKDKANFVWNHYARWSIPRPRLVEYRMKQVLGEKCERFRYDLSQDTDFVKELRKNLHVSGLYWSDSSDLNTCEMDIQTFMPPVEYFENGFVASMDNSVNACMYRLLTGALNSKAVLNPWIQLVWELESALPAKFDKDQTGAEFISFVRDMLTEKGQLKKDSEINRKNANENPVGFVMALAVDDFGRSENATGQKIEQYLSLWRACSLRFRYNLGIAIEKNRKM
jgi:hypothetical protein